MKKIAISLKLCTLIFFTSLSKDLFSQISSRTFTTSNTFTVPSGVTQINVQAWGAGGGGSDRSGNGNDGGNGGAGGGFASGTLAVNPGDILTITIGNGGNGATDGNGNDGFSGGNSFVVQGSNQIQANGGAGGVVGNSGGGTAAIGGGASFFGTVSNPVSFIGGNGGVAGSNDRGSGGGGAAGTTEDGGDGTYRYGGNGGNSNGNSGTGNGGDANTRNSGSPGSTYGGGGGSSGDNTGTGAKGANGLVILSWTVAAPEIDVTGISHTIIGDGSNLPTLSDNTDFGKIQIVSETITKTFVIENTGTANLTLGAISLSGATDFTIDSKPGSGTIIPPGGTEDIMISFATTTQGIQSTILTIASNDSNQSNYQINITAEGDKVFYDSDGDGVYDDVDLDDDNDGIIDSDEENACRLSSGASQADYKFLNETFGTGITRGTGISSLYDVSTTYTLEDGTAGDYAGSVGDGKYTVASFITDAIELTSPTYGVTPTGPEISRWAWYAWAPIDDHTPGDTDGRMAIFNAAEDPGIFYETKITGTLANVPVTYSFWVINIDEPDQNFIDEEKGGNASAFTHRNLPNVTVNFLTLDRSTVIATFDTGDITRCGDAFISGDHTGTYPHPADTSYNTCETSVWQQFTQSFNTSETAFIVQFVNNAPGGPGNDLAIDDIEVRQTLCDMDSDGVADVFDLDSDNDGIPDVVEANPTSASLSEGKASLTYVSTWADTNGNGVHDSLESLPSTDANTNGIPDEFEIDANADSIPDYIYDTDGDGIPDYIDLDSDNDGLFDVDEYGTISSSAPASFQNGDGDISGNGVGDGPETEAFREKDSEGDGTVEYYGDGILDIYDFHHGLPNHISSFGNIGQGTAPLYALDSDNDGIPDYRDPVNDLTGINDIDTVEIYAHLPNTAGVLDDTTDADSDGIMASRDGDDTVFGSPRNLDNSYHLYFDGRNDYVEDANVVASGSASLMAFIKSGGANTAGNNRTIAGQDNFYVRVNNSGNTITAVSESISLTSVSTLPIGIWTHVALTTESGGDVVLYINGEEEARDTSGSGGITSASNFMIGRSTTNNNYFNGDIEEVRVFNKALTTNELKRMVYQELDDTNGFNRGKIIPMDISATIGSNLVKYYKMDGYHDDILDNKTTIAKDVTGAKMYNFKDIYFQTAPLPYETIGDGDWTNPSNWLQGNVWDIMNKQNNPDGASIVHIKNNIDLNGTYDTQGTVGLLVDSSREFTIETDKGLYNSWYLELNGLLDLEGESQLIQTENSILEPTSSGSLERDQQGTSNTYTYNYWASPVGQTNSTTNNNSYTLPDIITNVGFLTSGYNGTISPVRNADYWIWKYANLTYDDYSAWQHVRSTGTMLTGEGFTMKGPGTASPEQNYIFLGKPNNGDITLPISAGNQYLVGNPYSSAIDADEFIKDNIKDGGNNTNNVINGALYFWEHFASNTHNLKEYEGGYGIYTLMGGTEAISNDSRINNGGGLASTKGAPGQYIPVGQGFFVSAIIDPLLASAPNNPGLTSPIVGGDILFKNSQRVFVTEASTSSIFMKNSNVKNKAATSQNEKVDNRKKIRLNMDSPKGYHRQILVGVDENASNNFDIGYDAPLIEDNKEDMFWTYNNANFIIQAVNNFDLNQKLPIGIKINKAGLTTIKIDSLENIEKNQDIYLHDKASNLYHNLKENDYQVYLTSGKHTDRFEITFGSSASKPLGIDDIQAKNIQVYYSNETSSIVLHNPNLKTIQSTEVFNTLGQSVFRVDNIETKNYLEFKTAKLLNASAYIINIKTLDGNTISKKVLVK